MAASTRRSSGSMIRSLSPSGRFCSSSSARSSSSAFATSSSTFSSRSSTFFHISTSPTPVNLYGSAPSVCFSVDSPISPSRSISSMPCREQVVRKPSMNPLSSPSGAPKRTCICSPTTHPGSFRCSFHKNLNSQTVSYPSNRLNAGRSAMTNSLVRIGTVEGDLVKRALAALIRPSSHQQRRPSAFQPSRSRLSMMSKADDV